MTTRTLFVALLTLVAILAGNMPQYTAAQPVQRWLADPAMLTEAKTIGPNGGQQAINSITDMELLDARTGWATTAGGLVRFDGRFWKRFIPASGTTFYRSLDMLSASDGWIAGSETERQPPYGSYALIVRFNGSSLQSVPVVRSDGTTGPLPGAIDDIKVFPNSGLAVGGQPSAQANWPKPLILSWDGSQWRDSTPAGWNYGRLNALSMVSPNEGWAVGLLGRAGGEGAEAVRAVIVHYKDGVWTEQALPELPTSGQPFGMSGITMTNASEGWAVFQDVGAACGNAKLLHYSNGTWAIHPHDYTSSITLGLIPGTNRGWASLGGCQSRGANTPARRVRFDNGAFTPDTIGAQLMPNVYALLNDQVQWAGSGGAFMRYSDEALPTAPVAAPGTGARFFPETGHTISGDFRRYYESHGLELGEPGISPSESLALFGYPVSEPFDEINPETGEVYRVQYFERARMELHPENPEPYRVLLGRLAFSALKSRGGSEPQLPNPDQSPVPTGCDRFAETGYTLCAPLRTFWYGSGGLPVFGFPITSARDELSATDNKTYLTQWFERERLEYHPELAGTPYEVLLGLLGSEDLRVRGYLGS